MAKTIIVTGGAGYIGAHTCLGLSERGYVPVVIDDLSNGSLESVQWGPCEIVDIRSQDLAETISRHNPIAIIHLAGLIDVAESVRKPDLYHDVNVQGSKNVIAAARRLNIPLVASSSCAVYGEPLSTPITEDHPCNPISPYGHGKLAVDGLLGENMIALRYFNAAGADPKIGERRKTETHIIPLAITAAIKGLTFKQFGNDYPTRDGSAERDYVHVTDLVDAHVRAVEALLAGRGTGIYNLGTGRGTTVVELLAGIQERLGNIDVEIEDRRQGDPASLLADYAKAKAVLGWEPRHGLDAILDSAISAYQKR